MIVVVNDANILIDLIKLDLLPEFFGLGYEYHTSDFVLAVELYDDQQAILDQYVRQGLLKVKESTSEEVILISKLNQEQAKLSFADCSVFLLAVSLKAILITSDNRLRKYSQIQDVEVHGHLWVLDRMVESGLLEPKRAILKLTELETVNAKLSLPTSECEKRKKDWGQ